MYFFLNVFFSYLRFIQNMKGKIVMFEQKRIPVEYTYLIESVSGFELVFYFEKFIGTKKLNCTLTRKGPFWSQNI